MGRTNPTFRNVLEALKARWGDYRRALRARDRPYLDRLFVHADAHADAAGYLNPDDPMDAVLVSMLLEHEKRLAALEEAGAEPAPDGPGGDETADDTVDADDTAQAIDDTGGADGATDDAPDRRSR